MNSSSTSVESQEDNSAEEEYCYGSPDELAGDSFNEGVARRLMEVRPTRLGFRLRLLQHPLNPIRIEGRQFLELLNWKYWAIGLMSSQTKPFTFPGFVI